MIKINTIFVLTFLMALISNLTYGQKVCLCDLELTDSIFYKNDSVFTGDYKCFNDNGEKSETGFVKNGLLDSTVLYKSSGKISEIIWYANNKPDTRRLYQNAGTTNLIINLRIVGQNDYVEHGAWERYSLNGQLKEQKFYENGKAINKWTTWDSDGRVLTETDFTVNPIVAKYHGYSKKKHTIVIKYTDRETGKRVKQEKITKEL
jgi:antitoxin component YwqK of YwqJK toxin-antitoxin module